MPNVPTRMQDAAAMQISSMSAEKAMVTRRC